MILDFIKRIFGVDTEETHDPHIYIYVREGKTGIETYYNENIKGLSTPIKKQLCQFVEGIKEELIK